MLSKFRHNNAIWISLILLSFISSLINASPAYKHRHIHKRALPTLVTTTSTTTTSSSTTSNTINTIATSTTNGTTGYNSNSAISNQTYSYNTSAITSIVRYSTTSIDYISNPVTIPNNNQLKNPNIIIRTATDGTVFIAFASCLGAIIIALIVTFIILSFKAWHSARHENHIKTIQDSYNNDPFNNGNITPNDFNYNGSNFINSDMSSFMSSGSESYDDNEKNSDLSEKILKNKNSRLSLYSLGSNSALNLLNNFDDSNNNKKNTNNITNPRLSMFISPTEILQNETHQWNNNGSSTNVSNESFFDSQISTPTVQGVPTTTSQFITNDYSEFNRTFDNNQNGTTKAKPFRPPSVHLDELLNLQDDSK